MEAKEKKAFEEYQHIQELRKLWSGAIMDWVRVGIPVGGALFGFFSYLPYLQQIRDFHCSWLLPLLGWLIFVIPMILWRVVAHHIDLQIVRMYPRMLELERELGWVTHATYYYNNLRRQARESLEDMLRIPRGILRNQNYQQYEQRCRGRRKPISLLLDAWNSYDNQGHRSVTSRGHIPQDVAVSFVGVGALVFASLLACNLINPTIFSLCVFLKVFFVSAISVAVFTSLLAWVLK